MKLISYGIKDNTFAYKHSYGDETTARIEPIKEKYLIFTLPWMRQLYLIAEDRMARAHPRFGIYWHRHPFARITFLRFGWS
jgi:hypothetical protein